MSAEDHNLDDLKDRVTMALRIPNEVLLFSSLLGLAMGIVLAAATML
jgi:uncharacterized membrane protein YsdA (DUF1294 family)